MARIGAWVLWGWETFLSFPGKSAALSSQPSRCFRLRRAPKQPMEGASTLSPDYQALFAVALSKGFAALST
ncbi:hypothetical protein D1223_03855 [Henriciella mobilis]|uniref:Uncharacterized protein n=1 Tax=Henriciella mobilis TaxID=2305467 RepID=A0A399RSI8_9PROT|nr:hypothetical protein D1223_03855 [Henriciella mobilis]